MSHEMTKPTKYVCAQRRLRCPVWSESSLCAQWVAKDPSFLHADSEDSDQTGWMPRLIRVFTGRTAILLVLSCHGSNYCRWLSGCLWHQQAAIFYTHFLYCVNVFMTSTSCHILYSLSILCQCIYDINKLPYSILTFYIVTMCLWHQ